MKLSNKLLVGLLGVVLLTLVGSTLALKTQQDSIDYSNRFYGFSREPIRRFTVLCIEGVQRKLEADQPNQGIFRPIPPDRYTTLGLLGGPTFEIRVLEGTKVPYTLRSQGDTLFVAFEAQFYPETLKGEAPFARQPFAYIIAPNVQSLLVREATCLVDKLASPDFTLRSTHARVLLSNSRITRWQATLQAGSLLQTAGTNQVGQAVLAGRDSTELVVGHDTFGSLAFQLDSNSTVKASMAVFRKVKASL